MHLLHKIGQGLTVLPLIFQLKNWAVAGIVHLDAVQIIAIVHLTQIANFAVASTLCREVSERRFVVRRDVLRRMLGSWFQLISQSLLFYFAATDATRLVYGCDAPCIVIATIDT